jgi:hypothetical protein
MAAGLRGFSVQVSFRLVNEDDRRRVRSVGGVTQ